jgi:hypothetical protein
MTIWAAEHPRELRTSSMASVHLREVTVYSEVDLVMLKTVRRCFISSMIKIIYQGRAGLPALLTLPLATPGLRSIHPAIEA